MKSILYSAVLFAFVVGLIIVDANVIKNTSAEMSGALAAVLSAEDPRVEVEKCLEVWERLSPSLHFLIDHAEIDEISAGIVKMREMDGTNLAAKAAELKFFIEHMPERERVTLKNIF